jgi:hypothetical protein
MWFFSAIFNPSADLLLEITKDILAGKFFLLVGRYY